jgi:PKHD-type hydroxylase
MGQKDPDADGELKGDFDEEIRSSKVKWLGGDVIPQELIDKTYEALSLACSESGWSDLITENEAPQYTVYDAQPNKKKGDFYTWHTDAGPEPLPSGVIRKLSMTIQLSDPDDYEGGHFQWLEPHRQLDKITQENTNIDLNQSIRTVPFSAKEKGSVVVFPSFVYHQVTPVLRGTRKSLVVWFNGQPYV